MEDVLRSLDIGCGNTPRGPDGWEHYGVDITAEPGYERIKPCNLELDAIPFPKNYFDRVEAYDILEHLNKVIYLSVERHSTSGILGSWTESVRHTPIIHLWNEIYRVLKPNGIFFAQVPKFPSWGAIADPTHVSFWIPDSLNYLSGDYFGAHALYGHTSRFERLSCEDWNNGVHMRFTLRAIKGLPDDHPYLLNY